MSSHLHDPETHIVEKHFAVVYTPRKQRNRFPENVVTVVSSAEEAIAASDQEKNLHPALVVGPSRSSEGFRLYYLVEWLGA